MTSLHKLNWNITPKCATNPEFIRLKKLCSVVLKGEIIIWQTHSVSYPGCWHANEAHLYNHSKWKTDNQIPSVFINIQLDVAYAKSCSWRNSNEWWVEHFGERRQTGMHNISELLVWCRVTELHAFSVHHHISYTPSSRFRQMDIPLKKKMFSLLIFFKLKRMQHSDQCHILQHLQNLETVKPSNNL